MNRNRIVVLLVAALCVAALAVAAATVDVPRESSPGVGPGDGSGVGGGDGGAPPPERPDSGSFAIPPLFKLLAVIFFAISVLVALYLAVKRLGLRDIAKIAVVSLGVLLVAVILLAVVGVPDMGTPQQPPQPVQNDTGGGGDGGTRQAENPKQQWDLPIALLGAFGLLAVVLVGAITRFSGSERSVPTSVETAESTDEDDEGISAVGEAAGRAADQLQDQDADVQNAVFRAWEEMTDALDVRHPETTTPEEFADIAVDAGMADDDVRELTWLFEEIRYGDAPVTDDRESRAEDALRRIEDAYAGGQADE